MALITDVAFVIPSYPPHYNYLYDLLDKLKKHNIIIDIFIVFSNQADYECFKLKDNIKSIVLKEPLNTSSKVTFKKFYALNQLINSNYDYFIVCDSEIDIIPENFNYINIREKIENIFKNKKIYAGDLKGKGIKYVNTYCSSLYKGEEYNLLKEATKEFTLYSWWSDIPVYRKGDLEKFFQKINKSLNRDIKFFSRSISI